MRLLGHPVHVMLIHFPVALWPAHWCFHVFAHWLPPGLAGTAGFWVLVGGTGAGWLAALAGLSDLIPLSRTGGRLLNLALTHAAINGFVLLAFTVLLGLEWPRYPGISHGPGALVLEGAVLVLLGAGNHFGGTVIWERMPAEAPALKRS